MRVRRPRGARLLWGGARPDGDRFLKGHFYQPTVQHVEEKYDVLPARQLDQLAKVILVACLTDDIQADARGGREARPDAENSGGR